MVAFCVRFSLENQKTDKKRTDSHKKHTQNRTIQKTQTLKKKTHRTEQNHDRPSPEDLCDVDSLSSPHLELTPESINTSIRLPSSQSLRSASPHKDWTKFLSKSQRLGQIFLIFWDPEGLNPGRFSVTLIVQDNYFQECRVLQGVTIKKAF